MASDVVVIGGGVIGCAIAWQLAREGARVTLVERDQIGAEASSAAGGILIPEAAPNVPAPLLDHWLAGLRMYSGFVAALQEETGVTFEYRTTGRLLLAYSEAEMAARRASHVLQTAAGVRSDIWSADQVRSEEPMVSPDVVGALYFPEHGLVDNRRLMICLASALARRGVTIQTGRPVTGILSDGDRAVGVDVCGDRLLADSVVNASGCWSGLIDRRFSIPVIPAKGQILALEARPPVCARILSSSAGSLMPRLDGRMIFGATVEYVGYDKRSTAGSVRRLLDGAIRTCPVLVDAPVVEVWAGLRPVVADHMPVVGPGESEGLFWASGHYSMGILCAPATAKAMAGLILNGKSPLAIDAFAPSRFAVGAQAR